MPKNARNTAVRFGADAAPSLAGSVLLLRRKGAAPSLPLSAPLLATAIADAPSSQPARRLIGRGPPTSDDALPRDRANGSRGSRDESDRPPPPPPPPPLDDDFSSRGVARTISERRPVQLAWPSNRTMHVSASLRSGSKPRLTTSPIESCVTVGPQPYSGSLTERPTWTRSPTRGSSRPGATRSISLSTPFHSGWRGKSTVQRSPENHVNRPTESCETPSPQSKRGRLTSRRTRTRSPVSGSAMTGVSLETSSSLRGVSLSLVSRVSSRFLSTCRFSSSAVSLPPLPSLPPRSSNSPRPSLPPRSPNSGRV